MVHLQSTTIQRPVVAVCVAVWKDDQVLLVKRRNTPNRGLWALPGGKIHAGELIADAAMRELFEETRLKATPKNIFCIQEIIENGFHYVLNCVRSENPVGHLQAGDDAADARWTRLADLPALKAVSNLEKVLEKSKNRTGIPL
jgi:ADP-ribose pyrophosphatase YjhB (NUDIX family)